MSLQVIGGKIKQFFQKKVNLPRPVAAVVRALQPRNLARTAVLTNPFTFSTGAAGTISNVPKTGFIAKTGNLFKSGYNRLFTPPTLKGVGKAAASAAGASIGLGLGKYAISGNPRDIIPSSRTFSGLLSLRIAPVAGVFGMAEAGLKEVTSRIQNVPAPVMPNIPNPIDFDYGAIGEAFGKAAQGTVINIGDLGQGFASGAGFPTGGFGTFAPSVSAPNVSVGGGADPITLAAIAALLGGGAGYLLGRTKKKRKRKKYKGGMRKK